MKMKEILTVWAKILMMNKKLSVLIFISIFIASVFCNGESLSEKAKCGGIVMAGISFAHSYQFKNTGDCEIKVMTITKGWSSSKGSLIYIYGGDSSGQGPFYINHQRHHYTYDVSSLDIVIPPHSTCSKVAYINFTTEPFATGDTISSYLKWTYKPLNPNCTAGKSITEAQCETHIKSEKNEFSSMGTNLEQ